MEESGKRRSRAIFVLGVHGSGSSAVSGALLRLGVMMGEVMVPGDPRTNPKGHFEDAEFRRMLYACCYKNAPLKPLLKFIEARFARYPIWGLKVPELVLVLDKLVPTLEGRDLSVIRTQRDDLACARSYNFKWPKHSVEHSLKLHENMRELRQRFIDRLKPPTLDVAFDDLTARPEAEARRMAEFAFEGLKLPEDARIRKAAEFIDPSLNHHREFEGKTLAGKTAPQPASESGPTTP